MSEPLLSVKNMKKTFQANGGMFSKKKFVHAVNDVSFDIYPGEMKFAAEASKYFLDLEII